ncbi:MAG: L,D-transpeptidase family protein [Verrucomicrobiota bacterium]
MKKNHYLVFQWILLVLGPCLLASCSSLKGSRPAADPRNPWFWMDAEAVAQADPAGTRIEVSLSKQLAEVFDQDNEKIIVSDVSTGVPWKPTPLGTFSILEKRESKRSNLYGKIIDVRSGQVVVEKAESRRHVPGPGQEFQGTPMPYWMRLTWYGVGMHVGAFQRSVRSSHGCIRMPEGIQPSVFGVCRVGTPVTISP